MKIKTTNIISLLVGLLVASNAMVSSAQADDKIPSNELKRELETFDRYLNSADTQLSVASNRFWASQSCEAIGDSLISALGNKDISMIKQDGFTDRNRRSDGLAFTRSSYDARFQKIQKRSAVVEDSIEQLVTRFTKTCPDWSNFFSIYRKAAARLKGNAKAEEIITKIINDAHAGITDGLKVKDLAKVVPGSDSPTPGTTLGVTLPPGWSVGTDGTLIGPNGPIVGSKVGPDGISIVGPDGATHTGGKVGTDGKIYFPDGWVYDPTTGAWRNGNSTQSLPPGWRIDEHGMLIGPNGTIPGSQFGPGGISMTSPDGASHTGGKVGPDGKIHFADGYIYDPTTGRWSDPSGKQVAVAGSEFDERVINENGQSKQIKIRTKYQGSKQEGKIDSEEVIKDGKSEKIKWAFLINQTEEKQGEGYKISFELVNTGTPANAAFSVTAWSVPEGVEKKESNGNQLTAVFPKPGKYDIKVNGKTKYDSSFTISTTVDF